MIVYSATKEKFTDDVLTNDIENIILKEYRKATGRLVNSNEINSWKNSLLYMDKILADKLIPDDCGVSIEYHIPQTNKRIDFIITGENELNEAHAIIIELKQWSEALLTDKDAIVKTVINRRLDERTHPSYQVWSYAMLLQGFNQTIYEEKIQLKPCAYLHNYIPDDVITNVFYADYIAKAPVFLKPDAVKLRDFIKRYIKHGDHSKIMYRIDHGKIKPSKALADNVSSMLKGNKEFIMVDEQKVVFENAFALAQQSDDQNKKVLIVEGGPGTGKSVVAINLLVAITNKGLVAQYVSKNAAPRTVYLSKLTGSYKKSHIDFLFKGSGSFINSKENEIDVLIVDEAHRLNKKSGLYKNLGENQIREIVRTAKCSIFFIDEDQKVTLDDIGDIGEIERCAALEGASCQRMKLNSQFRCNGADSFLAWLDNSLQIRRTANEDFDTNEYDFKICSSPTELRQMIFARNAAANKARMVAGYCWDWKSKKDVNRSDIVFSDYDFKAQWNLNKDGSLWIVSPNSVYEIGCIHTCQGLEVDYIGVIVGPDLLARNNVIVTDPSKRSGMDKSIYGYKKIVEKDPVNGKSKVDKIIKNTYRTLMTRGMKGCYVYFCDKETEEYFRSRIKQG